MNQFNLRRVLSRCNRSVLADFFAYHGACEHDIDRWWLANAETPDDNIFEAFLKLPAEIGKILEKELYSAHVLATSGGIDILVAEAHLRNLDLDGWDGLEGHLERALWFSMRHPSIWETGVHFSHADALQRGRYWIKRGNLPTTCSPIIDKSSLGALASAISAYFTNQEGRGHHALVEHYARHDGGDYYFVYLSDFVDSYNGFSLDGRLERRVERRTFEVIYAYHKEDGVLELHTKGGKQIIEDLQKIFARIILGNDLPLLADKPEYYLDMLLDPHFSFPTDPEDGIEKVAIHGIVCRAMGRPKRCTIAITSPVDGGYASIHDALSNDLSQERLPRELLRVVRATLCFYLTGCGPKTMKVTISLPNRSDLKSKREDMAALGRKYLLRWGIDRAASS